MISVFFDCEIPDLKAFAFRECALDASSLIGLTLTLNNVFYLGENLLKFDLCVSNDEIIFGFPTPGDERYGVKYVVKMEKEQFKEEVQKLSYKSVNFASLGSRYI